MDVSVTNEPRFVPKDYKLRYSDPCACFREGGQDWYKGTGVTLQNHPLSEKIQMKGCGACKSGNVKVIAAQWSVHLISGDIYWDYEVHCDDCGKFTQRSYAEN